MAIFDNFPYTNSHELNLDWIIKTVRQIKKEWGEMGFSVTADAIRGANPDVVVTGDLVNGLNFTFTLVKGDKGDTGNTGAQGIPGNGIASVSINGNDEITFTFTNGTTFTTPSLRGDNGTGLEILDVYPTLADLQTAHPTGSAGDAYLVGVSPSFELYIWSTNSTAWEQSGALTSPSPSISTPTMNGVANVGTENAYARGDHVHPSDTSKASLQDVYPVGSIYMNASVATNPAVIFGFGTWVALEDMFLLGASATYPLNSQGGEVNHILTESELPPHRHPASQHVKWVSNSGSIQSATNSYYAINDNANTGYTGDGLGHNNMPPYLAVHIWKRTA